MTQGRSGWRRSANLVTAMALGVVLAVLAVGAVAVTQIRARAWHDAEAEAGRVAHALRDAVQRTFDAASGALDGITRQLAAPELHGVDDIARRAALMASAPRGPAHGSTLVLDAEGNVLYDSASPVPRVRNGAAREYFWAHRDDPTLARHISAPFRAGSDGRWMSALSQRLDRPDGTFDGVVATAIEIGHLKALFEKVRIGPGGSIALMRDDGVFLMRTPFRDDLFDPAPVERPRPILAAWRESGGRPFLAHSALDGEDRLYIPLHLEGLPLAFWVSVSAADIRDDWLPGVLRAGTLFGALCLAVLLLAWVCRREMTRRGRAEEAASENAALFRQIADHSPDMVTIVGPDRRRRFVSAGSRHVLGVAPETLLDRDVGTLPLPEDQPMLLEARARLERGEADAVNVEYRTMLPDGRIVWMSVSLRVIPGSRGPDGVSVVAITRDITAQKTAEESLARRASIDPLTGALNRTAFADALAEATARHQPVAAVAIDLDFFKEVNDAEGHAAGDAVLRAVADRLRRTVRRGDAVARLGGDEFAVLVQGIEDEARIAELAERIREALHEPVPWQGKALPVGATLGVARAPHDGPTAESAMRAADEALIRAKRTLRGSIGMADAADARQAVRVATILRAVPPGTAAMTGIGVALQPMVRFDGPGAPGNTVIAVEALARWTHPELGPVPPDEAFRALGPDRSVQFGRAVRAEAFAAFARLCGPGPAPCRLAINLSATEVLRPEVILLVEEQAAEAGLGLDALMLEITEEVLAERVSDRALDLLAGLQRRGAMLALDDFGTGHAGMTQLLRLPFGAVKLDRRFVHRLGTDPGAREIVRAAVSLAHGLALDLIAEGVETEAQATALWALGCDGVQGYLVARPMAAANLEAWLRRRAGARLPP